MERVGLLGGVCVVVLVACSAAVGAEGEDLQRAIRLYNAQEYAQALELLQAIDPTKLTDFQRAIRTDYVARTQQAVQGLGGAQPRRVAAPAPRPAGVSRGNAGAVAQYQGQETLAAGQRIQDRSIREAQPNSGQAAGEISFEPGTTFGDAIDRIARGSGVNIFVNWPALEQVGITRDMEVTLPRLRGVTWRKVLDLLLLQVSAQYGGVAPLDWALDEGVLTISTRDDLSTQLRLRVYDIGDLLVPRQVVAPGTGFQLGTGGAGGTGTGVGGGIGGGLGTGGGIGFGAGGFGGGFGGSVGTGP